jgi:MFS family permease
VVRALVAVGNAFFMPACGALLADSVPREMRGRVMAALGRGAVMIGSSAGATGGPGLGFLIIPPLVLTSLLSGYLYAANPRAPWLAASVAVVSALWLAVRHVRDPHHAEV